MSENSKYEILLNELNTIETQASVIKNKYKDLFEKNRDLKQQLFDLKKINSELSEKISKFESKNEKNKSEEENNFLNSLNLKERETLKIKLQSLLQKIDYHLAAERQS